MLYMWHGSVWNLNNPHRYQRSFPAACAAGGGGWGVHRWSVRSTSSLFTTQPLLHSELSRLPLPHLLGEVQTPQLGAAFTSRLLPAHWRPSLVLTTPQPSLPLPPKNLQWASTYLQDSLKSDHLSEIFPAWVDIRFWVFRAFPSCFITTTWSKGLLTALHISINSKSQEGRCHILFIFVFQLVNTESVLQLVSFIHETSI